MLAYTIRRLLLTCLLFLALSYLIWLLTTHEGFAALDHPSATTLLPVRYLLWLDRVLHGDLGLSIKRREPVLDAMGQSVLPTLMVLLPAFLLQQALAIFSGLAAGVRPRSWVDRLITGTSYAVAALPTFWLALLGIIVLGVLIPILPFGDLVDLRVAGAPYGTPHYWTYFHAHTGAAILDMARHLTLPILLLAGVGAANDNQYIRQAMIEALAQEHIRAERARGISERRIRWHHALRNAAVPILANMSIELPRLVFAAAVIEFIFGIPGLGRLFVQSVYTPAGATGSLNTTIDYHVVTATLLIMGAIALLAAVAVDLLYATADPRIRIGQTAIAFAENPLHSRRPVMQRGRFIVTVGQVVAAVLLAFVVALGWLTVQQARAIQPSIAGTWVGSVAVRDTGKTYQYPMYADFTVTTAGELHGSASSCTFNAAGTAPLLTNYTNFAGNTDRIATVELEFSDVLSHSITALKVDGAYPARGAPLILTGVAYDQYELPLPATVTVHRGSQAQFQALCAGQ